MKKYARFLGCTVFVGLSASLCTASAQADMWGPAVPAVNLLPKYKVEALEFHCNDETGYDEPWYAPWTSDEVQVGIRAPATLMKSKVFGDVDSGESRSFAPDQSCILPIDRPIPSGHRVALFPNDTWTCSNAGRSGPFSFTVVMAEEDSGFFLDFPWGGNFTSEDYLPGPDDDLIGLRVVEFTAAELAAAMPNVGDTFDETIKLGPNIDASGNASGTDVQAGVAGPGEYTFTYRITRLALGSVLFN